MKDPKQSRLLVELAKADLTAMRVMRDHEEVTDEVFGFHAQQAVEKSLKAWIASVGSVYPLTHNLESLIDILEAQQCPVDHLRDMVDLTHYAVRFRYEQAMELGLDRVAIYNEVQKLVDQVAQIIGSK